MNDIIPGINLPASTLAEIYVIYTILSAAVQSMPEPDENSSAFYVFIYRFLSLLLADFKSFTAKKLPGQAAPTSVPKE